MRIHGGMTAGVREACCRGTTRLPARRRRESRPHDLLRPPAHTGRPASTGLELREIAGLVDQPVQPAADVRRWADHQRLRWPVIEGALSARSAPPSDVWRYGLQDPPEKPGLQLLRAQCSPSLVRVTLGRGSCGTSGQLVRLADLGRGLLRTCQRFRRLRGGSDTGRGVVMRGMAVRTADLLAPRGPRARRLRRALAGVVTRRCHERAHHGNAPSGGALAEVGAHRAPSLVGCQLDCGDSGMRGHSPRLGEPVCPFGGLQPPLGCHLGLLSRHIPRTVAAAVDHVHHPSGPRLAPRGRVRGRCGDHPSSDGVVTSRTGLPAPPHPRPRQHAREPRQRSDAPRRDHGPRRSPPGPRQNDEPSPRPGAPPRPDRALRHRASRQPPRLRAPAGRQPRSARHWPRSEPAARSAQQPVRPGPAPAPWTALRARRVRPSLKDRAALASGRVPAQRRVRTPRREAG